MTAAVTTSLSCGWLTRTVVDHRTSATTGHDRILVRLRSDDLFVAVCDGMGGLASPGEAVDEAVIQLENAANDGLAPGFAVGAAHKALLARWPEGDVGVAVAVATVHLTSQVVEVAWAGDVRVWTVDRQGQILTITADHTRLAEADGHNPGAARARADRRGSLLTRSLADPSWDGIAAQAVVSDPGRGILVGTDGAWGHDDNAIEAFWNGSSPFNDDLVDDVGLVAIGWPTDGVVPSWEQREYPLAE